MSFSLLSGLMFWSFIGIIWFSLFVVVLFRTRLVYLARHEDGSLKEKVPPAGILIMILTLAVSVGILLLFDFTTLRPAGLGFWATFGLNYALYLVVFVYDTLVIDYYIIGRWRPKLLQLPDAMTAAAMSDHIRSSVIRGPLLTAAIALLATALAHFLFF